MRTTKRGVRALRGIGQLGASLNLAPQSTSCPPGYHWEAPGPIMGLGACVPDPVAPAKKVIPLKLGPTAAPAPAPAPAPVRKNIPLTLAPTPAPAAPTTSTTTHDAAPAPTSTTTDLTPVVDEGPACDCWPWWWMVVAATAAAAGGYLLTGKGSRKRRRNAAEYVCDHVVRRMNPLALLTG